MPKVFFFSFRTSRAVGGSLFADFQGLQRIWTHPMVLRMNSDKIGKSHEKKTLTSDSEGSLKDFIDDGDESGTNSSSNSDDNNEISKRSTRNNSIGMLLIEKTIIYDFLTVVCSFRPINQLF